MIPEQVELLMVGTTAPKVSVLFITQLMVNTSNLSQLIKGSSPNFTSNIKQI